MCAHLHPSYLTLWGEGGWRANEAESDKNCWVKIQFLARLKERSPWSWYHSDAEQCRGGKDSTNITVKSQNRNKNISVSWSAPPLKPADHWHSQQFYPGFSVILLHQLIPTGIKILAFTNAGKIDRAGAESTVGEENKYEYASGGFKAQSTYHCSCFHWKTVVGTHVLYVVFPWPISARGDYHNEGEE